MTEWTKDDRCRGRRDHRIGCTRTARDIEHSRHINGCHCRIRGL